MYSSRHQLGFTMIELLITGVIGSIVAIAIVSTFTSALQSRSRTSYGYSSQNVSEHILDELARGIQVSDSAEISFNQLSLYKADTHLFDFYYDPDSQTLTKQDIQKGNLARLHPEQIKVTGFSILDIAPPTDPNLSNLQKTSLIQIKLTLTNFSKNTPRTQYSIQTSISLRPSKHRYE